VLEREGEREREREMREGRDMYVQLISAGGFSVFNILAEEGNAAAIIVAV
jgi:hypothetical protein